MATPGTEELPSLADLTRTPRPSAAAASADDGSLAAIPTLDEATGGSLDSLPSLSDLTGIPGLPGAKPPVQHHSLFHSIIHGAAKDLGKAANDIESFPGGLIKLGGAEYGSIKQSVEHPIISRQKFIEMWEHPLRPIKGTPNTPAITKLGKGMEQGTVSSLEHPLRDPFQTLLTLLPIASGAGKAIDAGTVAADEGAAAGLARLKPGAPVRMRSLHTGEEDVPLEASKGAAMRAVQQGYDKVLQHALDQNPEGKLAAHAAKKIGKSKAETARYQAQLREVPANEVEASMKLLKKGKSLAPIQVQQDALRLTSENDLPENAVAHHLNMADVHSDLAGKNLAAAHAAEDPEIAAAHHEAANEHLGAAAANQHVAERFQAVADHNIVHDQDGHLVINAEKFPHLAEADRRIAVGQAGIDDVALKHQGFTREGLQARIDAPNRYRAGAKYVNPTEARMGVPSKALVAQRATVDLLEERHARLVAKATENAGKLATKGSTDDLAVIGKDVVGNGKVIAGNGSARADRLGAHLSMERDKLERMEAAHANRAQPVGVVGGEDARVGRNFVSHRTSEPAKARAAVSSTVGPVVGEVKPFISESQHLTGEAMNEGKVPTDTVHMVAQHMRDAYRYVNTDTFRRSIIKTGSRVKRSPRDVLVRIPGEKADQLDENDRIALGQRKSTTEDHAAGEAAGYDAFLNWILPGREDKFARDQAQAIGTEAKPGYRWVDKNVLGDLSKPAPGDRGAAFRTMDSVNAAITAATVYFKVGHIGTRVLTNAATNIIQGSADPFELGKSVTLWNKLSHIDQRRALAAAGQKGFDAMPAAEESKLLGLPVGKWARGGAHWWAKHVDAPFRFNSLAYEARKAGFTTPEQFTKMLDDMENPEGLNAAETAKIDWVAKRANRQAIAYDRLSANERKYVTRGVWFYPWVKGASVFARDTLTEHPFKTAALGNAGEVGRKEQVARLGDLPSYEQGLIPLGHGSHPAVTDFSTFSPFSTPAQMIQAIANPSQGAIAGMANPAIGAIDSLIHGQNQYGAKSKNPLGDAISQLVAPTPEAQILGALLHPPKAGSNHMFRTTALSALARALGGPATPRRINLDAAHSEAARIRSGR